MNPLKFEYESYEEEKKIDAKVASLRRRINTIDDLEAVIEDLVKNDDVLMYKAARKFFQTTPLLDDKDFFQFKGAQPRCAWIVSIDRIGGPYNRKEIVFDSNVLRFCDQSTPENVLIAAARKGVDSMGHIHLSRKIQWDQGAWARQNMFGGESRGISTGYSFKGEGRTTANPQCIEALIESGNLDAFNIYVKASFEKILAHDSADVETVFAACAKHGKEKWGAVALGLAKEVYTGELEQYIYKSIASHDGLQTQKFALELLKKDEEAIFTLGKESRDQNIKMLSLALLTDPDKLPLGSGEQIVADYPIRKELGIEVTPKEKALLEEMYYEKFKNPDLSPQDIKELSAEFDGARRQFGLDELPDEWASEVSKNLLSEENALKIAETNDLELMEACKRICSNVSSFKNFQQKEEEFDYVILRNSTSENEKLLNGVHVGVGSQTHDECPHYEVRGDYLQKITHAPELALAFIKKGLSHIDKIFVNKKDSLEFQKDEIFRSRKEAARREGDLIGWSLNVSQKEYDRLQRDITSLRKGAREKEKKVKEGWKNFPQADLGTVAEVCAQHDAPDILKGALNMVYDIPSDYKKAWQVAVKRIENHSDPKVKAFVSNVIAQMPKVGEKKAPTPKTKKKVAHHEV